MKLQRIGFAFGVATMLAGLGGFSSAGQAADDGYENVLASVATSVGLWKEDSPPPIDYRERAPLVVPPKLTLNKPLPEGAGRPSSWPQDPDVLRHRREAEQARAPSALAFGRDPNAVMSKEDLLRGRSDRPSDMQARVSTCGQKGNGRGCLVVSPDKLKDEGDHYASAGFGDSKKELAPGEEPPRDYLTQPPHGYWKSTKVVKATTEAPKQQIDSSSPYAVLLDHPKADDDQ